MGEPFNIGHRYHVTKKKHTSPFFNLDRDCRGVLDQSQIRQYGLQQPWREPGRGWVGQHGLEVRQGHQLDAGQFGEVRVRRSNDSCGNFHTTQSNNLVPTLTSMFRIEMIKSIDIRFPDSAIVSSSSFIKVLQGIFTSLPFTILSFQLKCI